LRQRVVELEGEQQGSSSAPAAAPEKPRIVVASE